MFVVKNKDLFKMNLDVHTVAVGEWSSRKKHNHKKEGRQSEAVRDEQP
jgi:hypothetical protein